MTTASRVVVRGDFHCWRTKTAINTNTKNYLRQGTAIPWLIVAVFLAMAAVYLFFINSAATKGYQIKQIEKETSELQKESEQLKIREAELKSLYNIEESSRELDMAEAVQISYIEEKSPLAMK